MSKRSFNRPVKPRGNVQRPKLPGIQEPGKYGDKSIEGIEKLVGDMYHKGLKDLGNGLFDFNKPGGGSGGNPPVVPPGDTTGSNPLGGQGSWPSGQSSSPLAINDLLKDLQFGSNQDFLNQGKDGGTYGAGYWDMLNNIGYGDQMSKWLESIGYKAGGKLTDEQAADWNKQLLDQYIQYISKLEERNYAQGQLNDQRLYDSPTNMLARLMGAGISRDAAIQMISGSGGSGGSSNPLMSLGSMGVASGANPSESYLNGVQAKTAIANTVFNGVSAITGLVNMGVSAPMAIRQAHFLKGQNYLQDKQIKSYQLADQVFDILNNAGAASDAFGSTANAIDAIINYAKGGDREAASFVATGGVDLLRKHASFVSPVLSNMYKSERSSQDYADMYRATLRKADADADLSELQFDKLSQEIKNCEAEYDQINANTDYLKAMKITCEALGINYRASTRNIIAQAVGQELDNQATSSLYATDFDGKSYLDWRNTDILNKIVSDARISAKTVNPEYSEAMYKQMFNSAESVATAMSLAALKSQAGLEFASKYPHQFALWQGLSNCGAYDYLDALVKKNTSGDYRLPFGIGGSTSGVGAFDEDPLDPKWYHR